MGYKYILFKNNKIYVKSDSSKAVFINNESSGSKIK